jgi:hypothetical protein
VTLDNRDGHRLMERLTANNDVQHTRDGSRRDHAEVKILHQCIRAWGEEGERAEIGRLVAGISWRASEDGAERGPRPISETPS